jgi:hypothetical protein
MYQEIAAGIKRRKIVVEISAIIKAMGIKAMSESKKTKMVAEKTPVGVTFKEEKTILSLSFSSIDLEGFIFRFSANLQSFSYQVFGSLSLCSWRRNSIYSFETPFLSSIFVFFPKPKDHI